MEKISKGEFVEILFTGRVNGKVFDSNIPEDLRELQAEDPEHPRKTILAVGERMLVPGLDDSLQEKQVGQEYKIKVSPKQGFGERDRNLVKTIPLSIFTQQNVSPKPGASLLMDNQLVRIITISGARVITDFNNPLAGKELEYKVIIKRKVQDIEEKASALFDFFFGRIPKFELKGDEILVEFPKKAEMLVNLFAEKFKKLLGKNLKLKEITPNELEKEDSKPSNEDTPQKQEQ